MPRPRVSLLLIQAARQLSVDVGRFRFGPPVRFIYNPLAYARATHELYLQRFANSRRRVVFLGMNPGPFGMVQTGVPFGEVRCVRDWMALRAPVGRPAREHPRRPVEGFQCTRSEISGRRLWGLFADRFGTAEAFFAEHLVLNYCPLAFIEASGRNRPPDKLPARELAPLVAACDRHLRQVLEILRPEWAIGIGGFAAGCLHRVRPADSIHVGRILHPSPASPAANRDWADTVTRQLIRLGVWPDQKGVACQRSPAGPSD
jgi:single-strand selective monofunctional uracil DNA glycosylase